MKKGSVFLSNTGKVVLDSVVKLFRTDTSRKILVVSYGQDSEKMQQEGWDRTYSAILYLRSKGIDSASFVFQFAQNNGDPEIVDVFIGEYEGPAWVHPPILCYSYHKFTRKRCKDPH